MTVHDLIAALEAVENKSLPVRVDNPYGLETWDLDEEAVRVAGSGVLIQVGERYDADEG